MGTQIQTIDLPSTTSNNSVANIEQSRASSETQAAMVVAQKFPRNEHEAYNKIITACKRLSLAESGTYAFKRGTEMVTGPSIRLAEVMARCWGNISYGFREVGRNEISSEIETFCWDMEANVRVTRSFTVKHWRDTKSGGYAISQERDKYELIANQAQRRVRACILEMIPGDIVEAAENECKKTIASGDGRPIEDRIRDMLLAFKEFGIDEKIIESFLQHKVKAIIPAELVRLQQIYKSIKDGIATREEFFNFKNQNDESIDKLSKAFSDKKTDSSLDKTKEYQNWLKDKERFPVEAATLKEPKTVEECVANSREISSLVDQNQ